jgi:predicted dehydrogenase
MSMTRRKFLQSTAIAGASLAVSRTAFAQVNNDIKVALIGAGAQGRILLADALKIPGLRFVAVCDIWEWSQRYGQGRLRSHNPDVKVYEDYKDMLANEKSLDAVIVATPDCFHAEQTVACLKAGKHVYCEKEMSNDLEQAKQMLLAARETGKLLQIGHQRRSNPVYTLALGMLDGGLCGRLTNCYGQWNRAVQPKLDWPEKYEMPAETLKKYGYDSMDHFRNWRWYKKYSAGPIADLGSHQIDIFSWFLHAEPKSVVATGGSDYFPDREWYEDVMTIFEYDHQHAGKTGSVRAFYQVLNTNGYGNYFERFAGDQGTLTISESDKLCYYVPETGAQPPDWFASVETVERDGHAAFPLVQALPKKDAEAARLMADWAQKNVHQLHLENFFAAVRAGNGKMLTCPAEIAYPTTVAVLNTIPAIESGNRKSFTEADYKA